MFKFYSGEYEEMAIVTFVENFYKVEYIATDGRGKWGEEYFENLKEVFKVLA